MDTRNIGREAEQYACSYLEKNGLQLLARNYHCKVGEIDLIMRDKTEIVFVEVRKRTHAGFATAIETVTLTKQRKLVKTALYYLQVQGWSDKVICRFDIVGIFQGKTEWLKNAFLVETY